MIPKKISKISGYSGTPLYKKLGIKDYYRVKVKNSPKNYLDLLAPLPDGVTVSPRLRKKIDIFHIFTSSRIELSLSLEAALNEIKQNGSIWVSWPKKSSNVYSEITEDTIREVALPLGLVDVKVCAVDGIWSALKLVIRKELRVM